MNLPVPLIYLRNLPPEVRENVCQVLGEDRTWEALVRKLLDMQIKITTIEKLESTPSPADKLFDVLINHNFKDGPLKIATFYKISATLRLHKVMHFLAPHVDNDIIKNVDKAMRRSSAEVSSESNRAQNSLTKNNTEVYLHQLPEDKRIELCAALNRNDKWRFLMAKFEKAGFTLNHIQLCEMNSPNNPSSELFKLLADRNIKISHLYIALASMDLPGAMSILQCYVSENIIKDVAPCSQRSEPKLMNKRNSKEDNLKFNYENIEKPVFLPRQAGPSRGISYEELSDMTNQWSEENRLCSNGKGNFYRGLLGVKEVAVKRLLLQDEKLRLKVLQELRQLEGFAADGHKNVLNMLMLIEGGADNNPCIIYPFMKNKSLYDHLLNKDCYKSDSPTSCWKQKQMFLFALGVIEGLIYLQKCFKQQIVIVKSSDIILGDTMEPLVADVCLPSMLSRNRSAYVTMYLPQQEKREIESFCLGTILLELGSGITADRFDKHPEQLKELKEITLHTDVSKRFSGIWKGSILACTGGTSISEVKKLLEENIPA